VKSLVDEHVRGRRNRSGLLWRMLVLELWHRNFIESQPQWNTERRPPDIFAHETAQEPVQTEAAVVSAHPESTSN
jgi:hypothetical protein